MPVATKPSPQPRPLIQLLSCGRVRAQAPPSLVGSCRLFKFQSLFHLSLIPNPTQVPGNESTPPLFSFLIPSLYSLSLPSSTPFSLHSSSLPCPPPHSPFLPSLSLHLLLYLPLSQEAQGSRAKLSARGVLC